MEPVKIGYVRVSEKDQNPGRQIEKMKALGIDDRFLFIDKQSGKDFKRPRYQAMKEAIRKGDVVYIDSLDRLGRNYDGIISEWKDITKNLGADIIVLDQESLFNSQNFRAMGDMGKFIEDIFLSILSYVAEQERIKIRQRQREGIDLVKRTGHTKSGRPPGRPPIKITDTIRNAYIQWKKGKITAVEAMKHMGVSSPSFYRLAKRLNEEYKGIPMFGEEASNENK